MAKLDGRQRLEAAGYGVETSLAGCCGNEMWQVRVTYRGAHVLVERQPGPVDSLLEHVADLLLKPKPPESS